MADTATKRHEIPDDPTLVLDFCTKTWIRPNPTRMLIHPDGTVERFTEPLSMARCRMLVCGSDAGMLDTVNLRDKGGHVMLVDDIGHRLNLDENPGATAIYRQRAPDSTFMIRGPALIVPDADFAPCT